MVRKRPLLFAVSAEHAGRMRPSVALPRLDQIRPSPKLTRLMRGPIFLLFSPALLVIVVPLQVAVALYCPSRQHSFVSPFFYRHKHRRGLHLSAHPLVHILATETLGYPETAIFKAGPMSEYSLYKATL